MNKVDPHSETDADLVRRMLQGDLTAFDCLFARHRRGLRAYVFGLLNDSGWAEDIVQDCFLELVRRIGHVNPDKNVSGWLYRVARNKAIDFARHRKFETGPPESEQPNAPVSGSDKPDSQASPLDVMIRNESAARVQAAVAALAPRERDVIAMRFYGGLTFREIAVIVRRPLGTVLWQSRNALEKMKRTLKDTP